VVSRSVPADSVRFRATVEYDGAAFHGYQVQPAQRTVQGVIEEHLGRLFDRPVRVIGAGRTDTGVHAVGQEIAFDAPHAWDATRLERALGGVLPMDVAIRRPRPASPGFHPRFQATGRRYEYYLGPAGPLRAARVWTPPSPPDVDRLVEAAALLAGRRCFAALSRSGQPDLGTICAVESAGWTGTALGDLRFTIVADRFLHRMVRYIVATLVDVAHGRRTPEEWRTLLERGEGRPPEPAPARALYLTGVRYRDGWNRRAGVPGLWPLEASEATDAPVIERILSAEIDFE
jgi:tRNA pseudouridine38-40 synthase